MSIFRRRVPIVPRIVGRSPADYAQELQEFLKALLDSGEGRPAGWEDIAPTVIQAGTTATSGDPADGWLAASAIISIETATPSNATGSAASEGTGTALMRADATVKQGIVTTKGDLLSYSTLPVRVAVGSNGQILVADSAATPGVKWGSLGSGSFPLLAPDGTASAPSYSFTNDSDSGLYLTSSIGPGVWLIADGSTNGAYLRLSTGTARVDLYGGNSATPQGVLIRGGAATNSNVAGPDTDIQGGVPTAGNADGGNVLLTGGAPIGTGVRGRIKIPSSTWLQQAASRKMLTGDYTNATATFSNTALSIDVVSGRRYAIRVVLICADSTAADGIQIDFNGGSATATNFIASGDVSDSVAAGAIQETTTLAGVISAATITGVTRVTIEVSFEPSSTGTFILRAAQNAHTTGTLTIKRGSFMIAEDVA